MKIFPVGEELFHKDGWTDGRTDGQADMAKLTFAFHKFANAHKKQFLLVMWNTMGHGQMVAIVLRLSYWCVDRALKLQLNLLAPELYFFLF